MSHVVRVMVHDAWDEVAFPWQPDATLVDLKAAALEITRVTAPAQHFVIKWNGAELRNEAQTLAESGVAPDGALIVLRRRRRPVR